MEKLTIEEMRRIARARGGNCLSKNYVNNRTKLKWKCDKGHVWETTVNSINLGNWCHKCSHWGKLSLAELRKTAEVREGRCLSKSYTNSWTNYRWQCKRGHIWEANANNIRRGQWCPYCSQGLSERICRKYFERMFGKKFLHVRPKWLVTPNGIRLELDGYCEELKLAFEYQGGQHYSGTHFFESGMSFKKRKTYDKLKKRMCRLNGITLVTIPFWIKPEKMGQYIIQQCDKNGIEVPNKEVRLESFTFYYPEIIEELQEIARSRNGKLLSKNYIGNQRKLKWQCEAGHIWEAPPNSVKNGYWCAKCAFKRNTTKRRIGIEKMKEIAESRGGACLSSDYINANTKLEWRCDKGHRWFASADHIKNRSSWCPFCAHNVKLTIAEMQKIAKSRGSKCLSKNYIDSASKLKWQCKEGHVWRATPGNIKAGKWCPECSYKIGWIKRRKSSTAAR